MDYIKMLLSGLKSFVIVFLTQIVATIIDALTVAQGYVPQGDLASVTWTYLVFPVIAGIIAILNNYLKHRNDK